MKHNDFAQITESIETTDFLHMKKAEQKSALDKWLAEALRAIEGAPEAFTDWEKINLRDAISATYDGLFWLARAALHKAVLPNAPAYVFPIPAAEDLKEINLGRLAEAAEWLRLQPPQERPIFMRR
jgi:hypothetical protein